MIPRPWRRNTTEQFWARVRKGPGCWPWLGARTYQGYGRFSMAGQDHRAHRLAYEWLVGPIPAGLTLDHLCRNPICVNPAHLEPVSAGVNAMRAPTSIGAIAAARAACVHGHPFDEANTLVALRNRGTYLAPTRACRTCARQRAAQHRAKARSV